MVVLTDNLTARLFDELKAFLAEHEGLGLVDNPAVEAGIMNAWQGEGNYEVEPASDAYQQLKFRSPNGGYTRIAAIYGPHGFNSDLSNELHKRFRTIVPALEQF